MPPSFYYMKNNILFLLVVGLNLTLHAQSFELMPGKERIFIDAQYLKFFDSNRRVSLFSRARATTSYDSQTTDLFTGGYLNYTSKSGLGVSTIGRISSNSSGLDVGVHFFKANPSFMIFALPSIHVNKDLLYSWFSIVRFTPTIFKKQKLYTSLELFSAFDSEGHLSSVQRIRLGLSFSKYQGGIAVNINESRFSDFDINPGIFIRAQF